MIVVQLLGPAVVTRDGVVSTAPRGQKVWALLAYLALSERPPTRQQLIELLFQDAGDPAGTLRWNLSELRRLLGGPDTVGNASTVHLRLPGGSVVDVHVLQHGTAGAAAELPGLDRELIEGVSVDGSPGFTAWLLGERRRLRSLGGAVLREAALRALAADRGREAVELATRLVGTDPLSEDAHVLLVRAFAATGDEVAVEAQLHTSVDLFRRELGTDSPPSCTRPRAWSPGRSRRPGGRPCLGPRIARVGRGGGERRSGRGRRPGTPYAAVAAREASEPALEAAASSHSARRWCTRPRGETRKARRHSTERSRSQERRETGSARRPRTESSGTWSSCAATMPGERSGSNTRRGSPTATSSRCHASGRWWASAFSDVGRHDQAAVELRAAIDLAERVGHGRQLAWALACLGRTHLIRDELDEAEEALTAARGLTEAERWTTFIPFPEALLAEVWIRRGRLDLADEAFQHAFALGCSVDDACWEAYSVRGLGLLRAARGDLDGSIELMEDALTRCRRQRDTHRWILAYVMDALCAIATSAKHPRAAAWITDLASLAGRSGMQEFSVHAYLDRRDLGDHEALDAARTLAIDVENDHLQRLLDGGRTPALHDLLGKAASAV